MKRWGFGGQPATHGVSKTHRSLGSTGACQDPGRVWKGKKMAGRMGNKFRTAPALQVYKIDVKRDLVYVLGSVPGKAGTYVRVTDCLKKPHKLPPPFPTYEPDEAYLQQREAWESSTFADPLDFVRSQQGGPEAAGSLEPPFELVAAPAEHDPFAMHDWHEPEP